MNKTLVSGLTLVVLVLAGCSANPAAPPATPASAAVFPLTLQDDVGTQVTLKAEPRRIVSLAPNHTETLFALGLGERVVGVTEYCNYPPEATTKQKIGGYADINLEQVVALQPDLVLASTLHMAQVVPALRERGLTVFVAEPESVLDTLDTIVTIGRITGQEAAAQSLTAQMKNRIEAVQAKVKNAPRPQVFWELGAELYTAGPGSFINDLITLAGGENIAAGTGQPWPQMSVEAIILQDPDVIILADHNYGETIDTVKQRPGWANIRAVKAGRIIELVNDDIVSRQGPRIVDGLEFIARALHPELFK